MKTLAASLSILTREGVMLYLLRGVAFTCIISVLGVIMGLIVGSLLALARTYCKKGPARILGWFATAYIELFRNTPYLLWIFICVVFCPCPGFFARKMFGPVLHDARNYLARNQNTLHKYTPPRAKTTHFEGVML